MKTIFAVPTGGVQGTGSDNNNENKKGEAMKSIRTMVYLKTPYFCADDILTTYKRKHRVSPKEAAMFLEKYGIDYMSVSSEKYITLDGVFTLICKNSSPGTFDRKMWWFCQDIKRVSNFHMKSCVYAKTYVFDRSKYGRYF